MLPDWTAHRGDVRCGGRPHGQSSTEADGRRVFSAEFKRTTVQRIVTGEKTVAELSRELDIAPSVIRNWTRRSEAGATTAVAANEGISNALSPSPPLPPAGHHNRASGGRSQAPPGARGSALSPFGMLNESTC